ncbi:MAG: helix-turn-helix domain-containing protein [Nocardioides sp.]
MDRITEKTLFLTLDEVATHLRVSRRYIEQMVAADALASVPIGGNVRVRRTDLEAYVASLAHQNHERPDVA